MQEQINHCPKDWSLKEQSRHMTWLLVIQNFVLKNKSTPDLVCQMMIIQIYINFEQMNSILHLFPGQGIQKVGMHLGLDSRYNKLVKIVPGLQQAIENGPQTLLNQTEFAQPAIFLASFLRYKTLDSKIQYAIGHSVGEYAALAAAGCINIEDALQVLYKRGCIMRDCSQGRIMGMLAVSSNEDLSQYYQLKGNQIIQPALYNSSTQTVYSGDKEALLQFQKALKKLKIVSMFLEVSAGFHCSLLTPGKELLRKELKNIVNFKDGIKVIRNIDGNIYDSTESIIEGLTEQLDHPVQFHKSIQKIQNLNLTSIEYGATVLTKLLQQSNFI